MRSFYRVLVGAVAGAASVMSMGQAAPPTASLKTDTPLVVAGKPFRAVISITFAAGLHGYQNPPSDPSLIPVKVSAGDKVFSVAKIAYPKGTPEKVPGEDKPVNVYEGTIKIPVTLIAPAKIGKAVLKLDVGYQECNAQSCFAPGSLSLEAKLTVVKTLPKTNSMAAAK